MKRIFTLLILVFALTANADIIRKTYRTGNPVVKTSEGFQTINFPDMILSGRAGEPALPWQAVKLMLPPGHEAVRITFEGSNKKTLRGSYKLYPAQSSRPLSDNKKVDFKISERIYSSSRLFPESATGNLSTHFMNGYGYALATYTPVEYNPLEGTVSYYQSVTIVVETRPSARAEAALMNLPVNSSVKTRCIEYAQNPEAARAYPVAGGASTRSGRTGGQYDILIITPQSFSVAMNQLLTNYLEQGLSGKIITTQFINLNYTGVDNAEKIRNCIIHEYQNSGISQVVLAGDVEHVAYRGFYCLAQSSSNYEDNNIPSDLYYSGLDGNWNTDGDQLWAEIGEDDLLPDISVGRMPFSDTDELVNMITKTKQYQNNPIEGELNNHLLAGEFLYDNPETWGSDYLEMLIGYRDENGYITTGIPASYPTARLYDEDDEWSPQDLMNTINSGKSFISHVGHANENYTMKLYNSDITNSNFSGVNGVTHNFPIVYTHGCICGAFDVSDCIAERMVCIDNFAAAFVGNSRYGWFNEGQTEGPSAHIHREFMDALFTDSLNRIGSAHLESKIATAPWVNAPGQWEEGALRWCFYDCNVLGDPAMAVWTNEPIPVAITYPETIDIGSDSFEVTVKSMGAGIEGLTVALLRDVEIIGTGKTGSNGIATVTIDTLNNITGPATIKVAGYNCKPQSRNTFFVDPSGIDELPLEQITMYPNPVEKNTNINFSGLEGINRVTVKNLEGKTIREQAIRSANSLKLSIEGMTPGVYFIHFSGIGTEAIRKLVVQ